MESQSGGLTTQRLLDGLTPAQREAVCVDGAPLCILAGPGSGKTRVLTRRIAWRIEQGGADASHVLALTFTRKAAGELRRRLRELGVRDQVAAGTFHSVAYTQLRQRWSDRGEAAPVLLERKAGLLGGLAGAPGSGIGRMKALGELASEIEWAKARLVSPADYPGASADAGRRPALPPTEVAALYAAYEADKARRGLIDFDDLLSHCAVALETDASFAAAQRWRFRHLFVDEYQDVNPAQDRLLKAWLGERSDLCVVGDPRQAIYGWNGADPSALSNITRRYPSATVVSLDDNWRSSPQVLAVASAVLNFGKPAPRPGRGTAVPGALRANRPDGPVPTLRAYESDFSEALGIARGLRRAHGPGRAWSHLAVLVRTNAQLALIEVALQRSQIPHRVRGGQAFLADPVVRQALDRCCAGANRPFKAILADLAGLVHQRGEAAAAEDVDGSLQSLLRLAHEYDSLDRRANGTGFQAWLAITIGSEGGDSSRDAVELATFHRAKGLEWPCVFVAGLEQGLVPISQATTPAGQAEEQRLLYVALTRAESELHCSWAERRTFGERSVRRGPSPYLEAIAATCAALDPFAGTEGRACPDVAQLLEPARRQLEVARVRGRSGPGSTEPELPGERPAVSLARAADAEVIEALRSWRSATARASGVPAYVILHDATLAELATTMPSSPDELLAVCGVGPVKGMRYGAALLDVLAGYRLAG